VCAILAARHLHNEQTAIDAFPPELPTTQRGERTEQEIYARSELIGGRWQREGDEPNRVRTLAESLNPCANFRRSDSLA
jgi:hypothetical protein